MEEIGACIDNMHNINFKSASCVIKNVFPTNPHSMVSISGRNLTCWLLEDDVSTWSTPQIHTSAYSLPHFDALGHPQIDTSAYSRFHFDALGQPQIDISGNIYCRHTFNISLLIEFIVYDMQDS